MVDSSSRNQAEPERLEQAVYGHVDFLKQAGTTGSYYATK
jgi:hypothetical protein